MHLAHHPTWKDKKKISGSSFWKDIYTVLKVVFIVHNVNLWLHFLGVNLNLIQTLHLN